MERWHWVLLQFTQRLWVRASLFALLAVLTATLAVWLEPFIPLDLPGKVGADVVENVLQILASSMLAVTTFSLSIMVSSYAAASQNVTPRVTRLLLQDSTTQTALSTFVGAFLYGLVGLITLGAQLYGERGRVILFMVTLVVVVLVVLTILRWIDYLSRFGQMDDSISRVEKAARQALKARAEKPYLGGKPLLDSAKDIPKSAIPIFPAKCGYVQNLDITQLGELSEKHERDIYVRAQPGAFVHPDTPLVLAAAASGGDDAKEDFSNAVRAAYAIGGERSFEQDPRFGVTVLAEVACKALSPAINDSGTANSVLAKSVALFRVWSTSRPDPDEVEITYERVWVPPIQTEDLFDDFFRCIARDGAGIIEVQLSLHMALASLTDLDGRMAGHARQHSALALSRAQQALKFEHDATLLADRVKKLGLLSGRTG